MRKSEERTRGKLIFGTNHCTKISLIASWTCSQIHFLSLHPHYYSIEFFPSALNFLFFFCCWGQFLMNFSSQKIASAFERTNLLLYEKSFIQNCAIHTEIEQEMQFTSRSLTCCRWLRFITSQNFMQKQRVFRLEEILHVWHRTLSWHRNCIWRLFKWFFFIVATRWELLRLHQQFFI